MVSCPSLHSLAAKDKHAALQVICDSIVITTRISVSNTALLSYYAITLPMSSIGSGLKVSKGLNDTDAQLGSRAAVPPQSLILDIPHTHRASFDHTASLPEIGRIPLGAHKTLQGPPDDLALEHTGS